MINLVITILCLIITTIASIALISLDISPKEYEKSDLGIRLSEISNDTANHVSSINSSINQEIFRANFFHVLIDFLIIIGIFIIIISATIFILKKIKNKENQKFINEAFRLSGIQDLYPEKDHSHAVALKSYINNHSISKDTSFISSHDYEEIKYLIDAIKNSYSISPIDK